MRQVLPRMIAVALLASASGRAAVRSAFAYELSDVTGKLSLAWPRMSWDAAHAELYVIDAGNGSVEVFNDAGMSVYSFMGDASLGTILSIAPAGNDAGDLFALSLTARDWLVSRLDFRGEPLQTLPSPKLPKELAGFRPSVMRGAAGKLFFADFAGMKVVVLDASGALVAAYDLNQLLKVNVRRRTGNDLRGFNVDAAGNIYGTVPAAFVAFVISPDGQVRAFGTRGSTPGKFNIAAGIAADESGRIYISDTLRCVVMVWTRELEFAGEFGYRGDDEEGLIAPDEIAVGSGRVYVSQSRGGVKAFDVLVQ